MNGYPAIDPREAPLADFFRKNPRCALAFSGGVDSAYLLWAAVRFARQTAAYYVNTPFQPAFELADARRLAEGLGADLRVLNVDILDDKAVTANGPDRCYHCKRRLFTEIRRAAGADGYQLILDGTNASDQEGDRPGIRALRELSVRSPLREAGLTKDDIRRLSRQAGLFTWDKPAFACLATRIAPGQTITAGDLAVTETAEEALKNLGFSDFRVRMAGKQARIQLREEDFPRLLEHRQAVLEALGPHYEAITLDLEARL